MIVGTAGHIDHGKTALVRALTGVETDRLPQEKARGITIDLGFAYLPLADGSVMGFVDVPGHDRFVRNMLAGATGIDFVLLVVAADDGVMPQTREHFAIVTLLGLTRGAVAVTKCDLASPDRRAEVRAQVADLLAGTPLEDAPVIEVSAPTGQGIAALRGVLDDASATPGRADRQGLFRLAVDRAFTIAGAGTVVTGAVLSGEVAVDDQVAIGPGGLTARVRSIHAQNRPVDRGHAGQRCALNLTGDRIQAQAIHRGDMVLDPAAHAPADRIDAALTLLATEPRALQHWTPVRLHHAACEVGARLALLQDAALNPGDQGLVQLVLDHPIAAAVGDRFILRDTSGSRTMGGGRFIDLRAPMRRRRSPDRQAQLQALALPDPADTLRGLLDLPPHAVEVAAFARDRAMSVAQREGLLARVPHVRLARGADDLILSPQAWRALSYSARSTLAAFHAAHPQLLGPGTARLAATLSPRLPARIGAEVVRALVADGTLQAEGGAVRLPGHRLALDPGDHRLWQRILPLISGEHRFRPPQGRECAAALREREIDVRRVLKAMARQQVVVELAPDRFFLGSALRDMAGIMADVAAAQADGWFGAAQFRDRLSNGRKVAIEILEYFDRIGLTQRRDDLRRVAPDRIADYTRICEVRADVA